MSAGREFSDLILRLLFLPAVVQELVLMPKISCFHALALVHSRTNRCNFLVL